MPGPAGIHSSRLQDSTILPVLLHDQWSGQCAKCGLQHRLASEGPTGNVRESLQQRVIGRPTRAVPERVPDGPDLPALRRPAECMASRYRAGRAAEGTIRKRHVERGSVALLAAGYGRVECERPFEEPQRETYPALRPEGWSWGRPSWVPATRSESRRTRGLEAETVDGTATAHVARVLASGITVPPVVWRSAGCTGGKSAATPGRRGGSGGLVSDAFCSLLAVLRAIRYLRRAPMRSAPQSKERNLGSLAQ